MRRYLLPLLLAALAGCAALAARNHLDKLYGDPNPARYDEASSSADARASWQKVQPVFESRCVVCHACYDSPCQLNLSSFDGIARGANPENIYAVRLLAAAPTRLHIDAQTTAEWRKKGFHAVLNERENIPAANTNASVMHRLLELKRRHAPETGILPADFYDFSLDRAQTCPKIEQMDAIERTRPELGMPFGMPHLSDTEYKTLTGWIESGAPYAPPPALSSAYQKHVDEWEAFLNGDSLKEQLSARYIYEHWYLAHLYFDDLPTGEYFDLVRSSTPPGEPIGIIPTLGPYDDPHVPRIYYRLRRVEEALVAKTHMPYALNAARMARLRSWFLVPDYTVTRLPSYEPGVASNPFVTFQELPIKARYRLMLDEAQFTIMNFIKGPVCRGQVALNVINDYFWVAFADPDREQYDLGAKELAAALAELRLPAEDDALMPLLKWRKYSDSETSYLKAKTDYLNENFHGAHAPDLSLLWDGDGTNQNAALTIFRHFDSASVVKGLVGTKPQTMWIVGYPLFERIHYLLVAGYDVYGKVGHQITTRMYMDFLRMEGESNFLMLLPLDARERVRDQWYRGVGTDVLSYLQGTKDYFPNQTGIRFRTKDPLPELYGMIKKKLAPVLSHRYDLTTRGLPADAAKGLAQLAALHGTATSHLPEVTFVSVLDSKGAPHHYTLLHNAAHLNISTLFDEAKNRVPAEDDISLVDGFLGAYPNAVYEVSAKDVPALAGAVAALDDEAGYGALMAKYGIRRTDSRFWPHSDELVAAYRASQPVEGALFDYNRFENR